MSNLCETKSAWFNFRKDKEDRSLGTREGGAEKRELKEVRYVFESKELPPLFKNK